MKLAVELELEEDGRWIAEVPEIPGVMTYGLTREEALNAVEVLAKRLLADSIEFRETVDTSGERSILELHGLGDEAWKGIDAQEYVNELRDEWD